MNKKIDAIFAFVILLVLAGCSEVVVNFEERFEPVVVSEKISITGMQFGVFDVDGATYTLIKKDEIPLIIGQSYGWAMRLETKKKKILTRQIYALPLPPKKWNNSLGVVMNVSSDQKVSETEIEMKVKDGLVYGIWKVIEGDPEGESKIKVYLEEDYATEFTFKTVKP